MERVKKDLLTLLGYELNGFLSDDSLQDMDIQAVLHEASKHSVLNFIIDALGTLKSKGIVMFDDVYLEQYKNRSIRSIVIGSEVDSLQNEVIDLFTDKSIPYCILKGSSISSMYEKPRLRPSGDIDIYVNPSLISEASEIMIQNGYRYQNTTTSYHKSFIKGGIEVELHNSLPGLPRGRSGRSLLFLKELDKRSVSYEKDGKTIYFPNTCDNGIIQMCHILHHILDEGINLRLLCDWMMLVKSKISDAFWENELLEIYTRAGLNKMAMLLTKTCKIYLGFRTDNCTWCDGVSKKECSRFIDFIFSKVDEDNERKGKEQVGERYEGQLSEQVWEYNTIQYGMKAIYRNMVLLFSGKRNILRICEILVKRKDSIKLLVNLRLFSKKRAIDYAN